MASDPKAIRRFQAGVDRALGLFDASNEWADYIAFLSRLLKALQAAPTGADIPSKTILARHLAHCLTPKLPAGVHQKALEVYDCIFSILGQDGLGRDLPLYLPGFAPTLSFASLATRPWFLSLYDDHILQLPPLVLRPALKALILSLLPGIEEENSEDFDKTLATLNRIRTSFADDNNENIFWQSLFLASITSPSRRAGVLVYLVRYLPRLGEYIVAQDGVQTRLSTPDRKVVVTPEPGLLFRCFATGLQDEQPLTQRGFLDLLVTNLPLNASTLQAADSQNDLDILVAAAMSIVLRRDMSLNRRLWAWFFGSDDKSEGDTATPRKADKSSPSFFQTFGLEPVVRTFSKMIQKKSTLPIHRARPYRLLISLMDRSAIGTPVVDTVFFDLLTDLHQYQTAAPTQDAFDEVFRSASVFFDSIEPRMLARNLLKLVERQQFTLLEFIVSTFSLDEGELGRMHVPAIVVALSDLSIKDTTGELAQNQHLSEESPQQLTALMDVLLDLIPSVDSPKPKAASTTSSPKDIVAAVYKHYLGALSNSSLAKIPAPNVLVASAASNTSQAIQSYLHGRAEEIAFDNLASALGKLVTLTPDTTVQDYSDLIGEILGWCQQDRPIDAGMFASSRNIAGLVIALADKDSNSTILSEATVGDLVPCLVRIFWRFLGPSTPQYHVESVDLIWSLREICPELLLMESTVCSIVAINTASEKDHPSSNFAVFWTHTRAAHLSTGMAASGNNGASEDALPLLRRAVLLVIDLSARDSRWSTWMASLPSLNFHFQVILDAIREDPTEYEEMLVGLNRLKIIVQVASASPGIWKEFCGEAGPAHAVSELCHVVVKQHLQNQELALLALEILRIIHRDSTMGQYSVLIDTLTEQLPLTESGSQLQSSILDTLHALMSGKPDGDPPKDLMGMLMTGIAAPSIETNLDKWITLLCNSIPMYSDSTFFANLLKLTACFCQRSQSLFERVRLLYEGSNIDRSATLAMSNALNPERSIANLLSGLEYILARAHTKVIEVARPTSNGLDVAPSEGSRSRTNANNRLTVVLCMQDAIKLCGTMWFWRPSKKVGTVPDTKSFNYMSARLRSRTRRMLEHLLEAEPQECLETIMGIWTERTLNSSQPYLVINLLQTLDGARPKFMLPAIFNAVYSRTNPSVLDQSQRSSLSTNVTAVELVAFLNEYVSKLEDDLLEEIWSDCISFLRDILANPMPHRQLLLRLLEFLAGMCDKMENTTFGEQSRMRRELADLCTRLFTAIFTIKPGGLDQGSSPKQGINGTGANANRLDSGNGIDILLEVLPMMAPILSEGDRISTVYNGISLNITGPALRAKSFPENLSNNVLSLVQVMMKNTAPSKTLKKDVLDAFNDSRIFGSPLLVAEHGWLPTVRQLAIMDRGLFADVVGRLTAPAAAGIMFGVGASAARSEADRSTRGNLRRLALLLQASEQDLFLSSLSPLLARIDEILTATPSSSPSSSTRGDLYLVLRAIVLSFAQENLVSLWPVIDAEFKAFFEDMQKGQDALLTAYSQLQGAKLLDLLLLLQPEEFQMHEWLFITDTIDAIYPPATYPSIAAADTVHFDGVDHVDIPSSSLNAGRRPWLATGLSRQPKESRALLGSFFSQLSIRAFEGTYSLDPIDMDACRQDLLADIFSEPD
jgi:hypothetical protein